MILLVDIYMLLIRVKGGKYTKINYINLCNINKILLKKFKVLYFKL